MKITIYDKATGEIRQWGDIPEEAIASQIRAGEAMVEGLFPVMDFRWDGSKMVAKGTLSKHARLETGWNEVTLQRNMLLRRSDWHMLPDTPDTPEQQEAWRNYRTALREIDKQPDPYNVVWPTPPT